MRKIEKAADPDYGISRFDDDIRNTHGWRVSLRRYGKVLVENFPDKKCGGRDRALQLARQCRDELLGKYPPITRREVCLIKRSNNKSGISGVCTYAKTYKLKDGSVRETRYWEASWPGGNGKNISVNFSINKYGEELARSMAIRARMRGLEGVVGPFWVCERGQVDVTDRKQGTRDYSRPDRRVA